MLARVSGRSRGWRSAFVVGADAVLAVWLAVATLLCVRRLLGGMTQSLTLAEHAAVGLGIVGLAAVCRGCIAWVGPQRNDRAVAWALVGGSLLALAAFSFPPTSPAGVLLMWVIALVGGSAVGGRTVDWPRGDGRSWRVSGLPWARSAAPAARHASSTPLVGRKPSNVSTPDAKVDSDAEREEPDDQIVVQQFTRSRLPAGGETLAGSILVEFPAGSRSGSSHISFCPPLASVPEMQLELVGDLEATAKVAQIATFGARVDVTLANRTEADQQVCVEFYAHEVLPPDRQDA